MKIRTIYIECKKTHNYQVFTCGLTAELDSGEDVTMSIKELQANARRSVVEQIELERVGGR